MSKPRTRFMPRALWKLIQTRRSLGLKNATYSYLRSDPDTSLIAMETIDQPPKLNVQIKNSTKDRYIIWEATWQ